MDHRLNHSNLYIKVLENNIEESFYNIGESKDFINRRDKAGTNKDMINESMYCLHLIGIIKRIKRWYTNWEVILYNIYLLKNSI